MVPDPRRLAAVIASPVRAADAVNWRLLADRGRQGRAPVSDFHNNMILKEFL
jgi:hypothetical protein